MKISTSNDNLVMTEKIQIFVPWIMKTYLVPEELMERDLFKTLNVYKYLKENPGEVVRIETQLSTNPYLFIVYFELDKDTEAAIHAFIPEGGGEDLFEYYKEIKNGMRQQEQRSQYDNYLRR
jgi:hypothetical protein